MVQPPVRRLDDARLEFHDVPMDLRVELRSELMRRKRVNPRYSIRGMALSFRMSHTVLSRMISSRGRLSLRTIHKIGRGLKLTSQQVQRALQYEREAVVLTCVSDPRFRADCRWIASQSGLSVDDVNRTLFSLLSSGRVSFRTLTHWETQNS